MARDSLGFVIAVGQRKRRRVGGGNGRCLRVDRVGGSPDGGCRVCRARLVVVPRWEGSSTESWYGQKQVASWKKFRGVSGLALRLRMTRAGEDGGEAGAGGRRGSEVAAGQLREMRRLRAMILTVMGICSVVCLVSVQTRRYVGFGFFAILANVLVYVVVSAYKSKVSFAADDDAQGKEAPVGREQGKTAVQSASPPSPPPSQQNVSHWKEWTRDDDPLAEEAKNERDSIYDSFRQEWDDEEDFLPTPGPRYVTPEALDRLVPPVEKPPTDLYTSTEQGTTYSYSFRREGGERPSPDSNRAEHPHAATDAAMPEDTELYRRSASNVRGGGSSSKEEEVLTYRTKSSLQREEEEQKEQRRRSSSTGGRRRPRPPVAQPWTPSNLLGWTLSAGRYALKEVISPLGLIATLIWRDVEALHGSDDVEDLFLDEIVEDQQRTSWGGRRRDGEEWDRTQEQPSSFSVPFGLDDVLENVGVDGRALDETIDSVQRIVREGATTMEEQTRSAREFLDNQWTETMQGGKQTTEGKEDVSSSPGEDKGG